MTVTRTAPPASWSDFLVAVRASGLLSEAQFRRAVVEGAIDAQTGADVARHLVAAGLLTRFQAERLLAGKTDGFVLGQYVILDQVGRGPVSRVYKALHRAMNRIVAVKILSAAQTQDPARLAAFQAEVRSAAQLAHPNVVTILDANQVGGRFYLVLEYVDGPSAESLVRQAGPLPATRACEIVRQAALGLQHAHEKGIVHGALTPGCLLVNRLQAGEPAERMTVKVANFGLSRAAEPIGVPFSGGADPAGYRAPEVQAPLARPDVRADLYSLGGILFFLLTGRSPREETALTRPDVLPPVTALLGSLLAPHPLARPGSAGEVAARLEPFAESDDPAARIDFNLPLSGEAASLLSGYLTGLIPPNLRSHPGTVHPAADPTDTSPWAGLGDGPTLAEAPSPVRETPPPRSSFWHWLPWSSRKTRG